MEPQREAKDVWSPFCLYSQGCHLIFFLKEGKKSLLIEVYLCRGLIGVCLCGGLNQGLPVWRLNQGLPVWGIELGFTCVEG